MWVSGKRGGRDVWGATTADQANSARIYTYELDETYKCAMPFTHKLAIRWEATLTSRMYKGSRCTPCTVLAAAVTTATNRWIPFVVVVSL